MIFILVVLSPLHCVILLNLWRSVETTFQLLKEDGLLGANPNDASHLAAHFNKYFNSRAVHYILIAASFIVARWLIVSRSHHINWWGAPGVSRMGFPIAIYVSWIIWYQLLQHNYKGIVSIALMWAAFRRGVQLSLFHQDRVYGMGKIAQLLLLAYTTTILHGLAVIALWRGHFLTARDLATIVFIGFFFVVFVPLFFALPSLLLMKHIVIFKQALRVRLLTDAGCSPSNPDVLSMLTIDHIVDALPDHPFTRRMLALSGSGYVIQFVSAVVTIVQAANSG
jgi:hypothetical protein